MSGAGNAVRTNSGQAVLLFPAVMLTGFFVVPFGLMIAVSLFTRVPSGFYEPVLTGANYARFLSWFFADILAFSVGLSALVSAICVSVGAPFTYLLTRLSRRRQVPWLVALLAVLSLSEVIIGFAWSTLLSRTAGVSNLFVAVGLMDKPEAWSPGFFAVLAGMVYQAFPYSILVLFPAFSRLDPSLPEAARTLGASPMKAFFTVILPSLRNALVATFIIVFVFALGAYLLPQLLGRPEHWTLSVLITDQAIYQSNMPFAAAMAVFLVGASLILVLITTALGGKSAGAGDWPMIARLLPRLFFAAIALFMAAPLVVIAGVSVNGKRSLTFPPEGFSLAWYGQIFTDESWRGALTTSVLIALAAASLGRPDRLADRLCAVAQDQLVRPYRPDPWRVALRAATGDHRARCPELLGDHRRLRRLVQRRRSRTRSSSPACRW